MSSQDKFHRPSLILKKSIAEVVGHHSASGTVTPGAQQRYTEPAATPVALRDTVNHEALNILKSIGEVTYSWDMTTDKLVWGSNISDILPHVALESLATGMGFAELLHTDNQNSRYAAIKDSSRRDTGQGVPYQVYYSISDPQGKAMWIEDTGCWFAGARGEANLAQGVIRVVTESYEQRLASTYEAQFDRLTGAYNRDSMTRKLEASLETALREQKSIAVLLADIDNLGVINRAYGYDIADEVIAGLARRLRATMRDTDILARYAGNKFAFVLEACDQDQMGVAAKRFLTQALQTPVTTSAGPVHSSLRIGGAVAPRNGRTAKVLLHHAQEALEFTRANVPHPFVAYTPSLVRQDERLLAAEITRDVTTAINESRMQLALQPVVDARTQQPAFHEALIRIRRPDGSVIQPSTFLPTAERIGLIKILDQRMFELTLAHLRAHPGKKLAFNVSSATAHDPDWPLHLQRALAPTPELARNLIVEITETFAVDNLDTTRRVIEDMKRIGVSVAMDDFGSGHTSFRGLRHLNFDLIKIDGSFVKNLTTSADDRIFVRALIDLARHIGVPIVAEWVENAETARILTEWGVQYLQGYYFGMPDNI